jgi:hypothetical protein
LIGVAERRKMRKESESLKKRIENIVLLLNIDTPTPKEEDS